MEFPAFNCNVLVHCSWPVCLSLLRAGRSGRRRLAEHNGGTGRHWSWEEYWELTALTVMSKQLFFPEPSPFQQLLLSQTDTWAPCEICSPVGVQPRPHCSPIVCGAGCFPVVLGSVGSSPAPWAFPSRYQQPPTPPVVTTKSSSRHCQMSSGGKWPLLRPLLYKTPPQSMFACKSCLAHNGLSIAFSLQQQ